LSIHSWRVRTFASGNPAVACSSSARLASLVPPGKLTNVYWLRGRSIISSNASVVMLAAPSSG
jgi:hypothetical protein